MNTVFGDLGQYLYNFYGIDRAHLHNIAGYVSLFAFALCLTWLVLFLVHIYSESWTIPRMINKLFTIICIIVFLFFIILYGIIEEAIWQRAEFFKTKQYEVENIEVQIGGHAVHFRTGRVYNCKTNINGDALFFTYGKRRYKGREYGTVNYVKSFQYDQYLEPKRIVKMWWGDMDLTRTKTVTYSCSTAITTNSSK